jgi:long-subunit acyl-CoA synthetase (AMP-forming)
VEQQCLYGFGLTQPVMLCTLAETASTDKCRVEEDLVGLVEEINSHLEPHERMAGIAICETPWSVESGVLTHTLKVKRDSVADKYQDAIASLASAAASSDRKVATLWLE